MAYKLGPPDKNGCRERIEIGKGFFHTFALTNGDKAIVEMENGSLRIFNAFQLRFTDGGPIHPKAIGGSHYDKKLANVKGIGKSIATILAKSGMVTLRDIKDADRRKLENIPGLGPATLIEIILALSQENTFPEG
jgi:hypothetical protein